MCTCGFGRVGGIMYFVCGGEEMRLLRDISCCVTSCI